MEGKGLLSILWKIIKAIFNKEPEPQLDPEILLDPEGDMTKKALCVGINDYPGSQNDLKGCVNDCNNWAALLKKRGFSRIVKVRNSEATVRRVKAAINNHIKATKAGDVLVITFSGHGTSVYDKSGDEADGRDEALCLYDGLLLDDDLAKCLKNIVEGAIVTLVMDCCHSGTITRNYVSSGSHLEEHLDEKARVMESLWTAPNTPVVKAFGRGGEGRMKHLLLTGCTSKQYSYDAYINGTYQGALSYNASDVINKAKGITWNIFYKRLKTKLPSSQYPQNPQLEGPTHLKKRELFT